MPAARMLDSYALLFRPLEKEIKILWLHSKA